MFILVSVAQAGRQALVGLAVLLDLFPGYLRLPVMPQQGQGL
jgi:hypothetical protein